MVKIYLSKMLGERRMTQSELSKKTGIRAATINEIYHEIAVSVKFEHLDRICEVLDCSIPDLLEYKPNRIKRTGKDLIDDRNSKKRS